LGFCEFDGSTYALRHNPSDVLKRSGTTWIAMADQPGSTPREIKVPALAPGEMWCDLYVMYAGTDVWSKGYTCRGFNNIGGIREYDANGDILAGDWPSSLAEIIRTDYVSGKIPDEGRTHLLSMSSDGWFVYIGLLDGSNNPIILRVVYDLSTAPVIIRHTGAGTWGGVRCDYNHPERVWTFGDFGAASKALLSDNWGDTFTDITEGTWAASEVVRCILSSIYDHNDVVAILSTDRESWHSGDAGATWVKTGDIPYGIHCGERDWIDEFNVFVGRVNPGAEHIRFSPNNGVHWYEHSGGFEPNAPVTALQIVA